jgi:aliphatic sulfonates family ABC transporter substrate-binding protein
MRRLFPLLAAILFSLTAACAPAPAGNQPQNTTKTDGNYTVRIGFPASSRDTAAPDGPDVWAMDRGMLEDEFGKDGIKVQYIPFLGAAPAINEALAAGSLDMAFIADIGALIGKAAGQKTSLVSMGNPDGTPWWLVVKNDSPVQKVTDLKGKKVATIKATLPHFYLLKALERGGMKASDIELINMKPPDSEQALRSGQIDAAVTGNWMGVKFMSTGMRAIDSTKETPIGRGTSVFIATDKFIGEHPGFFSRFYQVRQRATDWANGNVDAAFASLVKNSGGVDRALLEPIYPRPFVYDQSLDAGVLERVKEGERFLRDLELTRNAVDVDAWVNRDVSFRR